MQSRNRFRPALGQLEERVVLSHAAPSTYSVISDNFSGRQFTIKHGRPAPVVSLVNAAFDQFEQDYRQVRSTYFGAIGSGTATASDFFAFTNYTIQRVELLAQQLTNSLLQAPLSAQRGHKLPSPLIGVARKINGFAPANMGGNPFAVGTLGNALISSTPGIASSATTLSLDSLAQDNASEAARVAMIDTVNIIKNGFFGNSKKH